QRHRHPARITRIAPGLLSVSRHRFRLDDLHGLIRQRWRNAKATFTNPERQMIADLEILDRLHLISEGDLATRTDLEGNGTDRVVRNVRYLDLNEIAADFGYRAVECCVLDAVFHDHFPARGRSGRIVLQERRVPFNIRTGLLRRLDGRWG